MRWWEEGEADHEMMLIISVTWEGCCKRRRSKWRMRQEEERDESKSQTTTGNLWENTWSHLLKSLHLSLTRSYGLTSDAWPSFRPFPLVSCHACYSLVSTIQSICSTRGGNMTRVIPQWFQHLLERKRENYWSPLNMMEFAVLNSHHKQEWMTIMIGANLQMIQSLILTM